MKTNYKEKYKDKNHSKMTQNAQFTHIIVLIGPYKACKLFT